MSLKCRRSRAAPPCRSAWPRRPAGRAPARAARAAPAPPSLSRSSTVALRSAVMLGRPVKVASIEPSSGLAVQHDAALVGGRRGRALGRAGQRQGAVRLQALARGRSRVNSRRLSCFEACRPRRRLPSPRPGRPACAPDELQHAIHVGRLEVEGDVGARLRRRIVGHRAAHREPRAGEVRHRDVVQPQACCRGSATSTAMPPIVSLR